MKLKVSLFVPITKTEKQADGTLLVYGKCTGPDLDGDQQIMDPAWLAKAMPQWFESGANVREMHQPIAAGVGEALEQIGDDWFLKTLVVDPGSVKKVEAGVLKGYSIGIGQGYKVVKDAAAPGGRVVDGPIVETSLVDRGSNPTCKMAICKADGVDGDVMVADEDDAEDAADEIAEMSLLDAARAAIAALIYAEAQELLEGGVADGAIRNLLYALDDLDWYEQVDAYEDSISKAAAATTKGSLMHLNELVASAKAATADDATAEQKAAFAELQKALYPTVELEAQLGTLATGKSVLADLIKIDDVDKVDDDTKTTIAGLRKVLGVDDLATATTKTAAELELKLEERLVKVEEMAAPGGPNRTRPADPVITGQQSDLHAKAAHYRQKAASVADPTLADGYRKLASQAELSAAALGTPA